MTPKGEDILIDDAPRASDDSRLKRPAKRARPAPDAHSRPSKTRKADATRAKPKKEPKKEPRKATKARREAKPEPLEEPATAVAKREPGLDGAAQPGSSGGGSGGDGGGGPDGGEQTGEKYRWWDDNQQEDVKHRWTTLEHNAVMFPPNYEPHGVPLRYDGKCVPLEPKGEEIATFYAAKLETDYVKKDTFNRNFFMDFRDSLKHTPAYAMVKDVRKCDFRAIAVHLEEKKLAAKAITSAEKKKMREEEAERCKKYTHAKIDGRVEKIGNFKVEPPGLFLGRGEHPKAGRVKARIYPEDITINLGEEAQVPECPMPDHKWGSIVHKHDVTWLCGWKDSITGGSKYVWLSAGSSFKGKSDHAKFEKARKLGQHINDIRRDYREGWKAKIKEVRQRSVAMYLIDKLALRVGNEKGDEEADTVGCCSLRVEHIKFTPPSTIHFDFLGKDSIRYENTVEVEQKVYDNLKLFVRNKEPADEIFHRLTVTSLNDYLKSLMDGLSAKVFRTYNASHTLDMLLARAPTDEDDVNQKVVFYNQQNKEVAILCNHQRSLPKAHDSQMEKLQTRMDEAEEWQEELERGRQELMADRKLDSVDVVQWVHDKPKLSEDMDEAAKTAERKRAAEAPRIKKELVKRLPQIEAALKQTKQRIAKLSADMQVKDDLKTVALGTSKINYLDPRITIAWCKKHDVPIEKIFARTLLVKFAWAMEASERFRFEYADDRSMVHNSAVRQHS